jgi:hypothetical protein
MFRFESDYMDPFTLLVPEPHLHRIHPLRGAFCCIGAPRANHRGRACLETRLYQCCYADVFSTYAINSWIVSYSLLASLFHLPTVFWVGRWHRYNVKVKILIEIPFTFMTRTVNPMGPVLALCLIIHKMCSFASIVSKRENVVPILAFYVYHEP